MRHLHIVVAEHDFEMRRLVVRRLRANGDHVVEAKDGIDLADILRAWYYPGTRAHPIDVIVTDASIPGLGGLEVADLLRAGPHRIPIVLTTTQDTSIEKEEAKRLGIAAIVPKPYDLDELRRIVELAADGRSDG